MTITKAQYKAAAHLYRCADRNRAIAEIAGDMPAMRYNLSQQLANMAFLPGDRFRVSKAIEGWKGLELCGFISAKFDRTSIVKFAEASCG